MSVELDLVAERRAMHPFDHAIALQPAPKPGTGSAAFDVTLDRSWWVGGSGPWGGYVSALFAKAIVAAVPELSLLSLTVHFVRRLQPAPAQVVVRVESRGSRVGHASARLVQAGDEDAAALAVATLGHNPQEDFVSDFPRPAAPPADEVRRRTESSHPYMQHLDVRPTVVVRPWSGDNEGTLEGWIRTDAPRPLDVPLLAALPDGWTPGMWARLTTTAGKVTVDLTTHFRGAITPEDSGPWFIRVRTRHVERGFADEECEVWGGDGRLLAQSRQLVLLAR
jgi:acyl-coenzyme A thioesterase PaaI-like protein